jgi:hypothetical protein
MLSDNPHLMPVIRRFDLSRFQEATRLMREKHPPGKVVLVP